ncbi:MAG: hypothetical protein UT50_C0005G0016 [Candidatus Moranbacteria bacterium GW2011_GWA2_39_41]|nr:MAG: hypothetical protein UT50_C0005G0016 [Candidatus Moranbacteria bacterium GW2011_GWA2_39_41]
MKKTIKHYSGMSLVEMLVAIGILTIAMAGLTALFMRTWKINSYTIEMGQSSFAVSQGVNTMVGYLRKIRQADDGSYPIKSATGTDLVVFSDYDKDGVTERLHLYLQDRQIKMGITDPTTGIPRSYPTGDQQIKILADDIVNSVSEPIFYYYNSSYPGDTAHNPVAMPVDVSTIRLVKIYLRINIDPNRDPENIETQSFVEFRNLNDYDRMK